jgi:hypothetical protein
VQVRAVDLDAGGRRDVGGGDRAGALLAQVHDDRLVGLGGDDQLLEVQDQVGDVLLDARHGGELVQDAVDPDAGDRSAGDRGQQGAAERVAEGVAEPGLERLEDEARAELGDGLLGQGGALCDEHGGCPFRTVREVRHMTSRGVQQVASPLQFRVCGRAAATGVPTRRTPVATRYLL